MQTVFALEKVLFDRQAFSLKEPEAVNNLKLLVLVENSRKLVETQGFQAGQVWNLTRRFYSLGMQNETQKQFKGRVGPEELWKQELPDFFGESKTVHSENTHSKRPVWKRPKHFDNYFPKHSMTAGQCQSENGCVKEFQQSHCYRLTAAAREKHLANSFGRFTSLVVRLMVLTRQCGGSILEFLGSNCIECKAFLA